MIKFSESKQAFYETDFDYPELPGDLVAVEDSELHLLLVDKINSGCRVFSDLSFSQPKPSPYCEWIDGAWVDPRTPEQKEAQYMASLKPLTRRQFKLTLLHYGMLETMESQIASIPDANLRIQLQIEYAESTTFMRTSPSVAAMVQSLGLTTNQVNQMWEYGMSQ